MSSIKISNYYCKYLHNESNIQTDGFRVKKVRDVYFTVKGLSDCSKLKNHWPFLLALSIFKHLIRLYQIPLWENKIHPSSVICIHSHLSEITIMWTLTSMQKQITFVISTKTFLKIYCHFLSHIANLHGKRSKPFLLPQSLREQLVQWNAHNWLIIKDSNYL